MLSVWDQRFPQGSVWSCCCAESSTPLWQTLHILCVSQIRPLQVRLSAYSRCHRWWMKAYFWGEEPVFSIGLSLKGYTSPHCLPLWELLQAEERDRWVSLAGYPVLSGAAGPHCDLLTPLELWPAHALRSHCQCFPNCPQKSTFLTKSALPHSQVSLQLRFHSNHSGHWPLDG